jgi:chromosomal replication initiator protein
MQRTTYLSRRPTSISYTLARESKILAITQAVAYFFGMPTEELHQNNTKRAVTVPRQIAMYLIKQMTDASLPEIGRQFGGKHHSTVMHAIARIEERRHIDVGLDSTISELIHNIRGQMKGPKASCKMS